MWSDSAHISPSASAFHLCNPHLWSFTAMPAQQASANHDPSPNDWRALAQRLRLSARELQITQTVFRGQKRQAIAATLGMSVGSVCTHFVRLYRKLGVGSRTELVIRIMREWQTMHEAGGRVGPGLPDSHASPDGSK
jgi:DNA-binding NarL/FixJ family response regulator